jgi:peptide chain release factor 1
MMARELLFSLTKKDFVVETFRAGGKGGQKQNKTSSGVRVKHPASGGVGESRKHRSQHQNKKDAFERLIEHPKYRLWHAAKCMELIKGETVEQAVEKQMAPENIKTEIKQDGEWIDYETANAPCNFCNGPMPCNCEPPKDIEKQIDELVDAWAEYSDMLDDR